MMPPTTLNQGFSLTVIEGGLTIIAIVLAFGWPRLASTYFSHIEHSLRPLAQKQGLAVAVVGLTELLSRLALLPLFPIPLPFVPDDFSFLLAADTFASGRLANPTPAMWPHFESIHITMQPTYMSMYFPAQGLVLAAGKILFGQSWFGVLLVNSLMCAAICWMLQAWLPPTWALLGGMIAILRLGLFSYWINTYSGGGALTALGGALVLGALPRFMRSVHLRDALLLAIGIILLATTRPYEGMLLCLPVAGWLSYWIFFAKTRPSAAKLIRCASLPLVLIFAAGYWMAYYDYRAFGNPLTLPYTVNRATYAMAPYYVWQSPRPQPVYHHEVLKRFYYHNELEGFQAIHTLAGFVPQTCIKVIRVFLFFAGPALLIPVFVLRRAVMDRRIRFLVVSVLVLSAGMLIEIFLIPHYLGPFTSAFYAIGLQAMRHLRLWNLGGQRVGLALVRFSVTLCVGMAALRLFSGPLHIVIPKWPASDWSGFWYGPEHFGEERNRVENRLEHLPGRQLVIVRYAPDHNSLDEWVYNAADIDNSKVIWAREMDAAENLKLMHYYGDRHVWLVQPDQQQVSATPYPIPEQISVASQ